jgi:hypothetical protein
MRAYEREKKKCREGSERGYILRGLDRKTSLL